MKMPPPRMRPAQTREALRKLNSASGYLMQRYGIEETEAARNILFNASVRVVQDEDRNVQA